MTFPFGYQPLGWKVDQTAEDYISHMKSELDRLAIDPYERLHQFTEVWRSLEHFQRDDLSGIQRYIDRLLKEVDGETRRLGASDEVGFQIRFRQNQLGDLTMNWAPDRKTQETFIRPHHEASYGFTRPLNELVFVKGLVHLRFPIDDKVLRSTTRIPTTSECLASDLLCCSRKWVEQAIVEVQRITTVEILSEFDFTLATKPLWTSATKVENLVVDWEIVQL